MAWQITNSVDEFLAGAGEFLRARPVEHTALLTITNTVHELGPGAYGDGTPVFGWCDGGAFLRMPQHGALLSEMPPAAATELAVRLAGTDLSAIAGPDEVADAFATEWQRLTGATPQVTGRQRLYRLGTLTPPEPPAAGADRVAEAADRELLLDWMSTFHTEIGHEPRQVEEFVDDKLSYGGLLVWEHAGRPVSMAAGSRPTAGMVRVQAVFTPPEHRAKGYAGAATVAVTRAALAAGATEVVLFTDLNNPTSNALYQRLGFTPIAERRTVEFPS
jgi:predicted GNAT family acetyltransferase